MTLDAALAAVVAEAVAPLVDEIRELRATVEALRAASPPKLVTVAELVRLGYGSPASIRRRIADGTYPCVRHGRSVRVDLATLKPIDPATVAALADAARRG
jgi:ABC-type transporter Mla MlaB component